MNTPLSGLVQEAHVPLPSGQVLGPDEFGYSENSGRILDRSIDAIMRVWTKIGRLSKSIPKARWEKPEADFAQARRMFGAMGCRHMACTRARH